MKQSGLSHLGSAYIAHHVFQNAMLDLHAEMRFVLPRCCTAAINWCTWHSLVHPHLLGRCELQTIADLSIVVGDSPPRAIVIFFGDDFPSPNLIKTKDCFRCGCTRYPFARLFSDKIAVLPGERCNTIIPSEWLCQLEYVGSTVCLRYTRHSVLGCIEPDVVDYMNRSRMVETHHAQKHA